jgi:hypothetical protein
MKNITTATIILLTLFFAPNTIFAQQYYECQISVKTSMRDNPNCSANTGRVHKCQIYDNNYSGSGTPEFCATTCLNRSNIPQSCANIIVAPSTNPEAHTGNNTNINNEILKNVAEEAKNKLSDVSKTFSDIKEKANDIKDKIIETFSDKENNESNEEDFTYNSIEGTGLNEYNVGKWPDENGIKVAKIVDPYGKERYTSDGKHFYGTVYDAAHSKEGLSNISNKIGDAWSSFTSIFSFKTKLKDKDKELQREIAREVLRDSKSQKEKDVETAYEKLSSKISVPTFGDIPAKAIVEIAKEANTTDFAGGVLLYIEQRKEGKSPKTIRANTSEELSGGYGTFGQGVSLSTTNKYAEAVLYARYEESYQRYLLAKEFGRQE